MRLADWTILLTDVPSKRLRFEEALVLLRERWQMELLYKLWKAEGVIDEWRTENPWRVLCELYAKLIGQVLQHWLMVVFAWHDPQRSLVKLAQVVRDTSWLLMDALAGYRSVRSALQVMGRRMRVGRCHSAATDAVWPSRGGRDAASGKAMRVSPDPGWVLKARAWANWTTGATPGFS